VFFRFIDRHPLSFHLKVAFGLGLFFRALCAYFAYGPLAMDDYIDGVSPALQWARGETPIVSPGRSYLLVWFLGAGIKLGHFLGIRESVVGQIRFLYLLLGIFSLSSLWFAYRFLKTREKKFAALFLYFLSLHAILPFAGTRAFGEAVAMPLVLGGILTTSPFLSGLLLGLATLLRFQCGLLFLLFLVLWKASPRYLGAGVVILALQLLVDWGSGYAPLQTLTDYLGRNQGWAVQYGVQPWYTHFLTLVVVVLFSFTLKWKAAIREHWKIAAAVGVFVVAHSLIPHKEERFLFPILPPLLLLFAAAWALKPESRFRWIFLPVNFAALFLISLSDPQAAMHEPIVEVQRRFSSGLIIETDNDLAGNWMGQGIFLKKPFRRERIQDLTLAKLDTELGFPHEVIMVTGFEIPEWLRQHPRCQEWHRAGSLTDRLLYWANPSHNTRRRPNHYGYCQ